MANAKRIEQLLALRTDLQCRLNRLECSKDSAPCVIEFNRRYSTFLENEISSINVKLLSAYGNTGLKKDVR